MRLTSSPNHLLHQRIGNGSLQLLCPPFFEHSASFEVSILLELFLTKLMFFQYFFSKQLIPVCFIFSPPCFWYFWFGIFGSRSMIFRQLLPNMRLFSGITGFFRIHQWPPQPQPTSTYWRVACTHHGVCFHFRRVMVTFFLPSLPQPGFRWFTVISCDFCWREASLWWHVVSTR
jgi:hypothetical protein